MMQIMLQAQVVYPCQYLQFHLHQQMKLKIPDDLSVMGFADLEFSKWMNPSLTTIKQNGRKMGIAAAETLVGRSSMDSKDLSPCRIRIECKIIKRGSTAVAPNVN